MKTFYPMYSNGEFHLISFKFYFNSVSPLPFHLSMSFILSLSLYLFLSIVLIHFFLHMTVSFFCLSIPFYFSVSVGFLSGIFSPNRDDF